ncbi:MULTISPECIES: HlyD family efflux transporter periplasmic adaptor subunit [unclassified Nodularia (in: cyanobacteria)]|uniref:HlyD family efflux transporter periplasmic adaptor subunit n=1 Tax=unclassified Nodularia (in: cyanobacteria) TaxID=2656917 RepID=UPI001883046C|nr:MULTISPECIES: HlyD family efflux transporter periplasmic adaptor subunit [unclassified Nodularia (in: cyanobacteria)]MBE9199037.1 HlyD family efflux transporter periplasmic adaptor subunit [Nodularia sp. LEGE 06071]MCC2695274.1 HlyD family efflux transporter periplasmic adaptor subunit [Nodularia sp. LEGE 04288]
MPNASPNSSSILLKKEQDEYQIYLQPSEETTNSHQTIPEGHTQDLYYGTEELLDALPKVWTRGVFYVLLGFASLALPWATLSKVDETGNARGRIEPQGATQKLDSQTGGSVKAVKVTEGQTVTFGQVLLELDSDILQTEIQQAEAKLSALLNQETQLDVLKNQLQLTLSIQKQQNQFQALEKMSQVNQAEQNLGLKQNSYNLQKLERQSLVNQVRQQIQTAKNDQQSAQGRLTIDSRQVKRFQQLVNDGAVSVNQVDQLKKEEQESQRLYARAQSDVKQAQLRLAEETSRYQSTMNQLESDIEQAKHQMQAEKNSYQSLLQSGKLAVLKYEEQLKNLETQLANLQSEIAQTNSTITSLNLQMQQRVVRSPIDGIIFELPVTKPGEVVQVGQRIADIAPQNSEIVLKANIPIQDSGFLNVGMPVKIKFDAFPFQEYGIVEGKVAWISPDSKINQTPQGNIETYELEIVLEQNYIQNGAKRIPLTPGQTANAEVILRQRRVIDFVLDPFKKLHKNGLEI